jgi:hypothetical protein
MAFILMDDPQFLNFNFASAPVEMLEPGSGPRESDLFVLVQQARQGVPGAAWDYVDVMQTTLRRAAFDSFQQTFGARAVEHGDWFCSKLYEFFRILLHDRFEVLGNGPLGYFGPPKTQRPWEEGDVFRGCGPSIHPDDLEAAFAVGEHEWDEFVQLAVRPGDRRFEAVRGLVIERARQRVESSSRAGGKTWQWTDNVKRDQIIVEGLEDGRSRLEICQILDQHFIPTTPYLRRRGYTTWAPVWNEKELRRVVQSLISKISKRAVKR